MVAISSKVKGLLVDEGLVTEEAWRNAISGDGDPIESLLNNGELLEPALMEMLGRAAGIAPVDLRRVEFDSAVIDTVAPELCRERAFIPVAKNGNVLTIAVSDPFDVLLFDDLKRMTHCHIRPVFSHRPMVMAALNAQLSGGQSQVDDLMDEVKGAENLEVKTDESEAEDIEFNAVGEDAPAVKDKASDIHVEPGEKSVRIRFRVDGRMREIMRAPKSLLPALTSRLKILAHLDIAERNAPQDGKFRIKYQGRTIDFRLSILPVVGGEKSVIRILDGGNLALRLDTMGFEQTMFRSRSNRHTACSS